MVGNKKVYGVLFTTPNGSRITSTYEQSVELSDEDLEKGLFLPAARILTSSGQLGNSSPPNVDGHYLYSQSSVFSFDSNHSLGKVYLEAINYSLLYRHSVRPILCE